MAQLPSRPRFGAHMSISGGLELAFDRAAEVGCECLQVFVKNQRQWRAPPLADDQVKAWHRAARATTIKPVVAHASYLINLATADRSLHARSVRAVIDELQRCEALGIGGLVLHPGSRGQSKLADGIRRIVRGLDRALQATAGCTARVLLETTAGQGTSIGHRFEHLGAIIGDSVVPDRLGVCIDTCHIHAAGYPLSPPSAYAETMAAFDTHIGRELIACMHLNDSVRELGARVDRHAGIGQGTIGAAGFRNVVRDRHLRRVPMILETPKGTDDRGREWDLVNLRKLKRMAARR